MNIKYYPCDDDLYWNKEVESILAYVDGIGLDVGCGGRSIDKDIMRLDLDPKNEPDIVASMSDIPMPDESFDFLVAQHAFEHIEDQEATLKEWLRVVKKGGYIIIIHPDVQFTGTQKPPEHNEVLRNNAYYKHFHERTFDQFTEYIATLQYLGFSVVSSGVALGQWSFQFVLRRNK